MIFLFWGLFGLGCPRLVLPLWHSRRGETSFQIGISRYVVDVSVSGVVLAKMAENGRNISEQLKATVDKEARLKGVKERQNEERVRKLEEIKAQALAAQRFKEQKEFERRQRIDELKGKEDVRRQQVEERKRAIVQAEQDRLVSILKRNQEREARIDAKRRNERSSIVFAFGSSTPRMLDPTDMTSSFWGTRRATSIQNMTCAAGAPLTRRQSERDLDSGSKKRATSAGGLERSGDSSTPLTPAGCVSGYVGRRRTDLMPTIPSRDSSFATTPRKSLNHSPGRAYSMSRLDQLSQPRISKRRELPSVVETGAPYPPLRSLSSPRQSSVTRSMSHLAVGKAAPAAPARKPLNKSDSRSMHQLSVDGPLLAPRTTRATQLRQQKLIASSNCSEASSRPSSSLSQQSTTSVTSSVSVRHRPSTAPRRPRPVSIAITGVTHVDTLKGAADRRGDAANKPPLPKTRKSISKDKDSKVKSKTSPGDSTPKSLSSPVAAAAPVVAQNEQPPAVMIPQQPPEERKPEEEQPQPPPPPPKTQPSPVTQVQVADEKPTECLIQNEDIVNNGPQVVETKTSVATADSSSEDIKKITTELIRAESVPPEVKQQQQAEVKQQQPEVKQQQPAELVEEVDVLSGQPVDMKDGEMTTSVTKVRINTEEEAKAALAERRRLAREEAERQAEQERIRLEMEAAAELERQRREEEQVQRLIELQRLDEQKRLEEAIKETQKRDEEERLRREEEQRSKKEKEEADRKAREEAEKKFAEQQERLKNEELEREVRRKRVEAIMRRTRGVNNANSPAQNNPDDKNENKAENKMNGTKPTEHEENGTTKNGKEVDIVDNIIPDETVKNANTMSIETINSTDSLNSNNTWQATQQYDSLM